MRPLLSYLALGLRIAPVSLLILIGGACLVLTHYIHIGFVAPVILCLAQASRTADESNSAFYNPQPDATSGAEDDQQPAGSYAQQSRRQA
ncbi:MAG TPA: hypothetical protein VGE07_25095 [Herpetosiphonaceae bacterium]